MLKSLPPIGTLDSVLKVELIRNRMLVDQQVCLPKTNQSESSSKIAPIVLSATELREAHRYKAQVATTHETKSDRKDNDKRLRVARWKPKPEDRNSTECYCHDNHIESSIFICKNPWRPSTEETTRIEQCVNRKTEGYVLAMLRDV